MRLSQLPERLFSLEQADLVLFALALGDKQHHQSDDAQTSHSQHHPQGGHVAAVAGGGGIRRGGLLRLLGLAGLRGRGRLLSAAAAAGERADVFFMDPPREGSTPQFIESVARMAPKRVVYVSCNPETMARDLALLTKKGYRAEGFTPVDMFPNSEHIEVVCALSRQEQRKQSRR